VVKLKASESDACSNTKLEIDKGNEKGKKLIDVDLSATVSTTKIQKDEPKDLEEGEKIFYSQMWMKGSLLQFIIDIRSQKNLILVEFMKRLGLLNTPHLQSYSIRWIHQGRDLRVIQQHRLPYNIQPFTYEVLCDFSPLEVCDVLLGQLYLWKWHVVHESRPHIVIITLGNKLYMIL